MRLFRCLPVFCATLYLAACDRTPPPRGGVTLTIHAPPGMTAPDQAALETMLFDESPELRGHITIAADTEPASFGIISDDPEPAAALALANKAAESLRELVGEHFRAGHRAELQGLKDEIEAQRVKVDESRRRMLELMGEQEDVAEEPSDAGTQGTQGDEPAEP